MKQDSYDGKRTNDTPTSYLSSFTICMYEWVTDRSLQKVFPNPELEESG